MTVGKINKLIALVVLIVSIFVSTSIITINASEITAEVEEDVVEDDYEYNGFATYDNGLDCYQAAMAQKETLVNFEQLQTGTTNANVSGINVKQQLRSSLIVDENGNIQLEDVTKSAIKLSPTLAINTYYDKQSDTLKIRETDEVDSQLIAKYNGDFSQISIEDYRNRFGYLPNESPYIVTAQTLKSESDFKFENDIYSFTLNLNKLAPKAAYKKKIQTMSNAEGSPNFTSCKIQVKIDKNGYFIEYNIEEKITLKLNALITVVLTNNIATTFNYD